MSICAPSKESKRISLLGTEGAPLGARTDILESVDHDGYDQIDHPEIDDDDTNEEVEAGAKIIGIHRAEHSVRPAVDCLRQLQLVRTV